MNNKVQNEGMDLSYQCPFREFKDTELGPEYWGQNAGATIGPPIKETKESKDAKSPVEPWIDEQKQPLPRSARRFLSRWVRAQELASNIWDAQLAVYEDSDSGKMNIQDIQLAHSGVISRSSFCRHVLSVCFMLERVEEFTVEGQWESFAFSVGTEGWRPKHHIYSPGMKPGGGAQHKPTCSRNGCYLVRLFYLGTWRCIWVDDLVPVDESDRPLLPFAAFKRPQTGMPGKRVTLAPTRTTAVLWPLLLCKALLKLVALNADAEEYFAEELEDEQMSLSSIFHALTGALNITFFKEDPEEAWNAIASEVPTFTWNNDNDTKIDLKTAKGIKKGANKDTTSKLRASAFLRICDTRSRPPYEAPGMTPGHEMDLLIFMTRDLPLVKPLPEPEVPQWKRVRWVDWARRHGLYESYECPRTRYLMCTGLLKLSYKPELLDVCSAQTITEKTRFEKKVKRGLPSGSMSYSDQSGRACNSEDNKDWIPYDWITTFVKAVSFCYYPSVLEFASAGLYPPNRLSTPNKPTNGTIIVTAPKYDPLYLQVNGQKNMKIWISLNVLHPRILMNCNLPVEECDDNSSLFVEHIEWFTDPELPKPKGLLYTKSYDAIEVCLEPGRHFFRLWINSLLNWHTMFLSDSPLTLGSRGLIMEASSQDCDWTEDFLWNIGSAFVNWSRCRRSSIDIKEVDREFYNSYLPDLPWKREVVGYPQPFVHWMFRRALESHLRKKMSTLDFRSACLALRRYLRDPVFGLPVSTADPYVMSKNFKEVEDTLYKTEAYIRSAEESTHDVLTKRHSVSIASNIANGLHKSYEIEDEAREKAITTIQSYWRRAWTCRMLNSTSLFTQDTLKILLNTTFGSLDNLSELMREFFNMFPGVKSAYTISTALRCAFFQKHTGSSTAASKSKWVPFFQEIFFCHAAVKVHLDLHSDLQQRIVTIYNNDTKEPVTPVFNAHRSYEINPNLRGYTILGHGWMNDTNDYVQNSEIQWQLTVLTSLENVFHVCEQDGLAYCKPLQMQSASRFHLEEFYIPNRRNILGAVQVTVSRKEYVVFHATASSSDLKMVAKLWTVNEKNEDVILDECTGTGEIYWPYISLEPSITKKRSVSLMNISNSRGADFRERPEEASSARLQTSFHELNREMNASSRSLRSAKSLKTNKLLNSKTKITNKAPQMKLLETKLYKIELIAPDGWPLTLDQWKRVEEALNIDSGPPAGKPTKQDRSSPSAKEVSDTDAFVELEVSLSIRSGALAKRDDTRDLAFSEARRSWDKSRRNEIGAKFRSEFHTEHRMSVAAIPTFAYDGEGEFFEEGSTVSSIKKSVSTTKSSTADETCAEYKEREELKYLTMPDALKDQFFPLDFLSSCRQQDVGKSTILTLETVKKDQLQLQEEIEQARERMDDLEEYNVKHVLGRQRKRTRLVSKFYVDDQLHPSVIEAQQLRETAIRQALGGGDEDSKRK